MLRKEEQELERRERALRVKEDALERRVQQQANTEERLKAHQERVAEKERANQKKAQELIQRERKLNDDSLEVERQLLTVRRQRDNLEARQKQRSVLVLPLLLFICVAAGYASYLHFTHKQSALEQVTSATQNIDKLASVLNMTQEEVLRATNRLANKRNELEKTKSMLGEVRATSEQLQQEITDLRGNQAATLAEKEALSQSANTLAKQLADLRSQLEDEYLTIDINEAFIEYQESDLQQLEQLMAHYKNELATRDREIARQQDLLSALEAQLATRHRSIGTLQARARNLQTALDTAEARGLQSEMLAQQVTDKLQVLQDRLKRTLDENAALKQAAQTKQPATPQDEFAADEADSAAQSPGENSQKAAKTNAP